jgi:hypothetical protein
MLGKNALSFRSPVVRKTAGILARLLWLATCITALVYGYSNYRGPSDWKVEEGLAFEMMVLSFPASFLLVAAIVVTGVGLGLFGLELPPSSRPEMTATWLLFVAAGYVQWFVVLPKLLWGRHEKWQRRW